MRKVSILLFLILLTEGVPAQFRRDEDRVTSSLIRGKEPSGSPDRVSAEVVELPSSPGWYGIHLSAKSLKGKNPLSGSVLYPPDVSQRQTRSKRSKWGSRFEIARTGSLSLTWQNCRVPQWNSEIDRATLFSHQGVSISVSKALKGI